ncbi:MAG: hypothetical protein HY393_00190 [Candidatus Diapherotrites archaeon]|nr:hypothetical protein [Candidatus Diapherotrites archaeon]
MFDICVKCKGRLWCGPVCWVLEKHKIVSRSVEQMKGTSFQGSSPPSLFVSWTSYPNVTVAPMAPTFSLDDADLLDNPERWYGLPAQDIIGFREQLVRSTSKALVQSASNPSRELARMQELVLGEKSVEVEVELAKRPHAELSFSDTTPPMGPHAPLKKFRLTENPSVPQKVDALVADTQALSQTAVQELFEHHIPVHYLYKILSAGMLGVQRKRKLVPTRWAITAIDSNLSNYLVEEVKAYSPIQDFRVFHANYVDNDFWILLLPSEWQFEQMEAWKPGGLWTSHSTESRIMADHEFFGGRKKYASNVAGAYYSARLAVGEYLRSIKRQSGCVIFREIGVSVQASLGVWKIRETVRHALKEKPLTFYELPRALDFLSSRLSVPLESYLRESNVLSFYRHQKRITEYLAR